MPSKWDISSSQPYQGFVLSEGVSKTTVATIPKQDTNQEWTPAIAHVNIVCLSPLNTRPGRNRICRVLDIYSSNKIQNITDQKFMIEIDSKYYKS